MGIVFRQSIKATIVTLVGAVLGVVCNICYVKILTIQTNGFRTTIFDQAQFFQFVILLGTTGTIATYIHRFSPGPKRKLLQTFSALVPLAGILLLLTPYLIFRSDILQLYKSDDRALVDKYYLWIPTLVLLWSYLYQIEAYLTVQYKSAIAAFMREIVIRIVNLALIALYYYQLIDFTVFIAGCILAYALAVILLVWVARKTEGFGFTTQWNAFSKTEYKELARFSWYHLLMGIAVIGTPSIASYMLGVMSPNGFDAVAVYGIAIFISGIMIIPFRAMASAAYTTINLAYTNNDMAGVKSLFNRASINIFIVSVLMTVLIACNLDNALIILNKPGYEKMIPLVMIMMIGKLVDCSTGLNSELISFSKYYKFNYRISVALLFLLVLFNYLLIPRFDTIGAAWGITLSLTLFNVAKIIFLYRKFGIKSYSKETLLIIFAGAAAGIGGFLLPVLPHFIIDVMVRSAIVVSIYAGMMFWLKPSADLRNYLQSVKEKKKLF